MHPFYISKSKYYGMVFLCVEYMTEAFSRKTLLDLAAALFLLGSVIVLIISILNVPIATVYPVFRLYEPLSYTYLVAIVIEVIGAVLGFDCFNMTSKRKLASAGIRGVVIGAVILSAAWATGSQIIGAGAILILIAGIVCYVYRE